MKTSSAAVVLALAFAPSLWAQDLFERYREADSKKAVTVSEYRGRDRLDLQLSADGTKFVGQDRRTSKVGVSAYLDYDFACGRFDVRTNLQNLLAKEAREEFAKDAIEALLGEMVHNQLVLICESSPTVCQALQHYRISANAMLGMQNDWCQAIESAVDDANQSTRAKAIKDCIEQERARGKTLDQAREACDNPDKIRGLDGKLVSQIDLLDELRRAFGLPHVEEDFLVQLISSLRYSPKGGEGEIKTSAALDRHKQLVDVYGKAWNTAIKAAADHRELTPEELSALSPEKASRVSSVEVVEIAALSPGRREVVLRSLVSSAAMFQLALEVGAVVKFLDAARKHPAADQGFVRRLEQEREDLERQLAELTRLHELQERHNQTLLDAISTAQADRVKTGTRTILAEVRKDQAKDILTRTPRWGSFPETQDRCCDVKGRR